MKYFKVIAVTMIIDGGIIGEEAMEVVGVEIGVAVAILIMDLVGVILGQVCLEAVVVTIVMDLVKAYKFYHKYSNFSFYVILLHIWSGMR